MIQYNFYPFYCYCPNFILQGKADDQRSWRVFQNEKLARLREKLRHNKEELVKGWLLINDQMQVRLKFVLFHSSKT